MARTRVRKTRGKGAYGLIKARYIHNRSAKTGRHVTADLKRVMYYNVYGNKQNNPEQRPRGYIYDELGHQVGYKDYKDWGIQQGALHNYSYRVIISPKGKLLEDEDFVMAVAVAAKRFEMSKEFRLVVHRDSDHVHGHLLFMTNRTIRKAELEDWKVLLRQQIMGLEEVRAREKRLQLPMVEKMNEEGANEQPTLRKSKKRDRGLSF